MASFANQFLGNQNIYAKIIYTSNEMVGNITVSPTGIMVIPFATTGTTASTGAFFYNTSDSKLYMYNGAAWIRTSQLS